MAAATRSIPPRRAGRRVAPVAVAAAVLAGVPASAAVVTVRSDTVEVPVEAADLVGVAIALSEVAFADDLPDRALLGTTADFADALASAALQGDAPLLLTPPDGLRADVEAELQRLDVEEVLVLGGQQAIHDDVVEELEGLGIGVERLAGATRIETAIEVADLAPDGETAILTRAFGGPEGSDPTQGFADALAAGAWAADQGWPVLLSETARLSTATRDALAGSAVDRVVLVGGTSALSAQVADDLEALGLDVDRVAGPTRFGTAAAIATARGFDDEEDAVGVALVEGQRQDAWAAGFASAALAAQLDAPVLLANGDVLPAETTAYLADTDLGIDETAVAAGRPVVVCAAATAACEALRLALGLPASAEIGLDPGADGEVAVGEDLAGAVLLGDEAASVTATGSCIEGRGVQPDDDGAFELRVVGPAGPCTVVLDVRFADGIVQTTSIDVEVVAAPPVAGVVVDTETGGDRYTFVADGGDDARMVAYDADDTFSVNGQAATIGAFEAALTVADRITYEAGEREAGRHDLVDVDPATITSGTIGDIDLEAGTFAFVEQVTGTVLRAGVPLRSEDGDVYRVGSGTASAEEFAADLNEGDELVLDELDDGRRQLVLENRAVIGSVDAVQVDAEAGVARFRIGGLGDDPSTAQDDLYVAAREDAQRFVVDGTATGFDGFIAALSAGDAITYRRLDGIELFRLTNDAAAAVEGAATELVDPDGSPVAPQERDGGSVVVLTADGRTDVTYTSDAEFLLDGAVATEAEVEAALTAGDLVRYRAADPSTEQVEELRLDDRVLVGAVDDISEGDDTYDVVTPAGVLYEDLRYTGGVFGAPDTYVVDGESVGLAEFEAALTAVDQGDAAATVAVVPAEDGGTEHHLDTAAA